MTKVGWSPDVIPTDVNPIVQGNVRLQGSFSHNFPVWERVIHLLDAIPRTPTGKVQRKRIAEQFAQ